MNNNRYREFIGYVNELQAIRGVEALLDWDQETNMPKGAATDRATQLATIAGIAHEKLTSDTLNNMLSDLEREGCGDNFAAETNIREIRRDFDRAVKLPKALVEKIARTVALAKGAWVQARAASRFSQFAPHLEELLGLKRQVADAIGWTTEPYDALMDEYEPDARAAHVADVFNSVKAELVPLVAALKNAPRQPDRSIRARLCPRAAQEALNRRLITAMGYDFEHGRLDVSAHPFCTSFSPCDVRVTTRYDERYMTMSLFGCLHEAGHALYEQGFDAANAYTPMAQAVSLGIHESQSRLWENQVGRSRAFWRHFYPELQAAFPVMADVALDDWVFVINTVEPSLIRVEADEVTYSLHIMLRFELERKMISGELAVRDVPEAWNAGMKSLLGITPPNDGQGCLQDIHWSLGTYGYFPTYALGNLYAAQFFEAAQTTIPDLEEKIGRGELMPLREWLRENVHRQGKRYRANELIKVVTGRDLSPEPFVRYLHAKYEPLYGLA